MGNKRSETDFYSTTDFGSVFGRIVVPSFNQLIPNSVMSTAVSTLLYF